MAATPTVGISARITLEDMARMDALQRRGYTQKDIFIAGVEALEEKEIDIVR